MPEPQTPATPAAGKNGQPAQSFENRSVDPPRSDRDGGRKGASVADAAAENAKRQAEEAARATEMAADRTAQATQEAARANTQILRTQIETAQQAVRSGLEASVRSFESFSSRWARALGANQPNTELADQSVQNVRAVSQASTALAKGAQEASRAWFELTQKAVRTNLEALSQLAGVRTMPELIAVQSDLMRNNLEQVIQSGEEIARCSTDAIREATQVMEAAGRRQFGGGQQGQQSGQQTGQQQGRQPGAQA